MILQDNVTDVYQILLSGIITLGKFSTGDIISYSEQRLYQLHNSPLLF